MSLQAGHASLKKAANDLFVCWSEVRSSWRDEVAQEFEDRFITPLLRDIRMAQEAMARMASVLAQVRSDCE